MEFVIISGRSGSGKSTALQLLEDAGYTCIDNLPINLLQSLINEIALQGSSTDKCFAMGIDARDFGGDLSRFPALLEAALKHPMNVRVVYLDASDQVLMTRYSETRRKHPLSNTHTSLKEAIQSEASILQPIAKVADITVDTSHLSLHELRSLIKKQLVPNSDGNLALSFTSFGFKYGTPTDADYIFDVRSLPNPYWEPTLRQYTGLDTAVIEFLDSHEQVASMKDDILHFLQKWVPSFEENNRSYLTVAIGCTGGVHRSVYIAEYLAQHFSPTFKNVMVQHRQLPRYNK